MPVYGIAVLTSTPRPRWHTPDNTHPAFGTSAGYVRSKKSLPLHFLDNNIGAKAAQRSGSPTTPPVMPPTQPHPPLHPPTPTTLSSGPPPYFHHAVLFETRRSVDEPESIRCVLKGTRWLADHASWIVRLTGDTRQAYLTRSARSYAPRVGTGRPHAKPGRRSNRWAYKYKAKRGAPIPVAPPPGNVFGAHPLQPLHPPCRNPCWTAPRTPTTTPPPRFRRTLCTGDSP